MDPEEPESESKEVPDPRRAVSISQPSALFLHARNRLTLLVRPMSTPEGMEYV